VRHADVLVEPDDSGLSHGAKLRRRRTERVGGLQRMAALNALATSLAAADVGIEFPFDQLPRQLHRRMSFYAAGDDGLPRPMTPRRSTRKPASDAHVQALKPTAGAARPKTAPTRHDQADSDDRAHVKALTSYVVSSGCQCDDVARDGRVNGSLRTLPSHPAGRVVWNRKPVATSSNFYPDEHRRGMRPCVGYPEAFDQALFL
jgi:hypothetical protein